MKTRGQRQSENYETEMNRPQKDDRFAYRDYSAVDAARGDSPTRKQVGGDSMDSALQKGVRKGQWMGRTRMGSVYGNQDESIISSQRPGNFIEHINKSYKSRNQ